VAQIFPRWTNKTPLLALGAVAVGGLLVTAGVWYYFSPRYTDVGYMPRQPVPYSHKLHAGDLGIDCRYCHAMVERSAIAGVPPTQTCMNCHRIVGRDKETLAPIRDSAANGLPMRWIRVHDLPGFAYFDHSVHLAAGVGCSTCHGDVAQMDEVRQVEPLSMSWCLDCHRNPDPYLRPRNELTDTSWEPPANQIELARRIREQKGIAPSEDCGTCHR
jgi:hypothetical protein